MDTSGCVATFPGPMLVYACTEIPETLVFRVSSKVRVVVMSVALMVIGLLSLTL